MIGVDKFVEENITDHNSNFRACLELVIFSYCKLRMEKTYKRSEIEQTIRKVRGKQNVQIELEDYLRNDLVEEYFEKFKRQFGLRHFLFQSGAEEFHNNVKVGILDIKVRSTLFNGKDYYIFECKRFNKELKDKYVTEGIIRFIKRQYYPEVDIAMAAMIAFIESANIANSYLDNELDVVISDLIKKHKKTISLKKGPNKYSIKNSSYQEVNSFDKIYLTKHIRLKSLDSFDIYHLLLDYNSILQN